MPGPQVDEHRAAHRFAAICLALVALAFAARLALAWYSIGTNDAGTWLKFAKSIDQRGLLDAYVRFPSLNHPPPAALWSGAALRVARATGMDFEFTFKLPMILADVGSCLILMRIWRARRGARHAWIAATLLAWSPCAILVGAYHCNTDNVLAFFCLLGCWCADRRKMFAAGLALAAAINVKLIPVLLILPLLSLCRERRDVVRFVTALAIGAMPFVPILVFVGPAFARNALAYSPQPNRWSFPFLLYEVYRHGRFTTFALDAMRIYFETGRWFIFAGVALLGFFSWRRRAWDAYQLGAVALAIFLVLAPGFGLQYTVAVAPLLLAVGLRVGALYNFSAGTFLLIVYWSNWTGTVPMYSYFEGPYPMPGPIVGVVAWAVLVVFALRTLFAGKLAPAAYTPPRDAG